MPSLPPETPRRKLRRNMNGHRPVNYRELAPVYLRQGYLAPIPLPHGRKAPPPNGFTGHHNTQPPTAEQVEEWRKTRGDDGIAFVLQENKYPQGDRELSAESAALHQIKITAPPK